MKTKTLLLLLTLCLTAFTGAKASYTYQFSSPNELDDFVHYDNSGPSGWVWKDDAGFNGTPGLSGTYSNTNNSSYYIQKQGFAGNTSGYTLAATFQWMQPVFGNGHGFVLGVIQDTTSAIVQSSPGVNLFYFGIGRSNTANEARIIGNWANETGSGVSQPNDAWFSMTPGSWYHLSGDVTWQEASQTYSVAITLSLLDAEGNMTLVTSRTFTTGTLSGLGNDPSVHAFFGSYNNVAGRGTQAVDRFVTPVPEPGLTLYVAGALAGLAGFRRFRKK